MSASTAEQSESPDSISGAQPSSPSWWRPDVQGLRAVAVLGVVFYHAGLPLPGGFTGVDVFFVISGFVIGGLLLRDLQRERGFAAKDFYLRRARRLLPAAALMIVVVVGLSAVLLPAVGAAQSAAGMAASAASVFLSNFYFLFFTDGYFDPNSDRNPFLHTWSLSVEEQFYLVLPWLLVVGWLVARRLRHDPTRGVGVVVGLGWIVSFALCVLLTFPSLGSWLPVVGDAFTSQAALGERAAFFSPMTRSWEFLTGVGIVLLGSRWQVSRGLAQPMAWAGLAIIGLGYLTLREGMHFPGFYALVPVLGAALVILAGQGTSAATSGVLASRPMVAIGDVSYGWYLWHWPLIVFAAFWFDSPWALVFAALLSLLPTLLSYRLVEDPIRHRRWLASNKAMFAVAVVCVLVPFLAGQVLVKAQSNSWGRADIAEANAAIRPAHLDQTQGCTLTSDLGPDRGSCLFTVPGAERTVLLIGDSNAGMYSEPALQAARNLGVNLQIAAHSACPIAVGADYGTSACRDFVTSSLAQIQQAQPPYAGVIVVNSGDYAVSFVDEFQSVKDGNGQPAADGVTGYATAVANAVKQISPVSPVLFIVAIPQGLGEVFPGCLAPSALTPLDRSCASFDAEFLESNRNDTIRALTASLPEEATLFDPGVLLCQPDGTCSMYRGDQLMYRDQGHLSVQGSLQYTPLLQQALSQLLANGN